MKRTLVAALLVAVVGTAVGTSLAADGPMADAGLDQTVTVDTTVQLDATGSTHPGGSITSYEWQVVAPDGTTIEPTCSDCGRSSFVPRLPGRYEATVTVTTDSGSVASDALYVTVADAGPAVELTGPHAPAVGEPVAFTASVESPDAALERVWWSVDDRLTSTESATGVADESVAAFAFDTAATHRVQVVVADVDGRTAYDEVYVRPRGGTDGGGVNDASGQNCSDEDYRIENPAQCGVETTQSPDDDTDEPIGDSGTRHHIEYLSDGFASGWSPMSVTSAFVGTVRSEVGLDGGENAPWLRGGVERLRDAAEETVRGLIWGQSREELTCEIDGSTFDPCRDRTTQLEETGETSNVHSPDASGTYQSYGIRGGERVDGPDPTELDESDTAIVTVVTQRERDGIVDVARRSIDRLEDRSSSGMRDVLGSSDDDEGTNTADRTGDTSRTTDDSGSDDRMRMPGSAHATLAR